MNSIEVFQNCLKNVVKNFFQEHLFDLGEMRRNGEIEPTLQKYLDEIFNPDLGLAVIVQNPLEYDMNLIKITSVKNSYLNQFELPLEFAVDYKVTVGRYL